MTDRHGQRSSEERDRAGRDEEKRRQEEKDKRSDQLREAWRRNHPSEPEEHGKDRPGRGGRA